MIREKTQKVMSVKEDDAITACFRIHELISVFGV